MVTLSSFVANAQAVNDEGAVLTTTSHCDFRPFAYLQVYPSGPCFFAVQYNTVSHTRVLSHKAQVGRLGGSIWGWVLSIKFRATHCS